jgi:hypothetical protein
LNHVYGGTINPKWPVAKPPTLEYTFAFGGMANMAEPPVGPAIVKGFG